MTHRSLPNTTPSNWKEVEIPLFPKLSVASSFSQRVRGLLGAPPEPQLLLIAPCHSIHTFGMEYPIHIAFFDRKGVVIESERSVPREASAHAIALSAYLRCPLCSKMILGLLAETRSGLRRLK